MIRSAWQILSNMITVYSDSIKFVDIRLLFVTQLTYLPTYFLDPEILWKLSEAIANKSAVFSSLSDLP